MLALSARSPRPRVSRRPRRVRASRAVRAASARSRRRPRVSSARTKRARRACSLRPRARPAPLARVRARLRPPRRRRPSRVSLRAAGVASTASLRRASRSRPAGSPPAAVVVARSHPRTLFADSNTFARSRWRVDGGVVANSRPARVSDHTPRRTTRRFDHVTKSLRNWHSFVAIRCRSVQASHEGCGTCPKRPPQHRRSCHSRWSGPRRRVVTRAPSRPPLRALAGGAQGPPRPPGRPPLRLIVGGRASEERGQASVEFVALLPLILVIVAVAWQALLAGQTVWEARVAARAAARANAFGGDATAAARAHLPAKLEHGLQVDAKLDGDVRVSLRVPDRPSVGAPRAGRRHLPLPAPGRMNGTRGQASVEVIGFLPLVLVVALAAFTVIASHTAHEQAGEAAEAGALVLLQGGDSPADAAQGRAPREHPPPSRRSRSTATASRSVSARASSSRFRASPTACRRSPRRRRPGPAMTALARALDWFIAPDPRAAAEPPRFEPDPLLALSLPTADPRPISSAPALSTPAPFAPPLSVLAAVRGRAVRGCAVRGRAVRGRAVRGARRVASVARATSARASRAAPALAPPALAPPSGAAAIPTRDALVAPRVARVPTSRSRSRPRPCSDARRMSDPMAAGVALALRRETRAKVASVVVLGDLPRDLGAGGSGGPAGRRIAARLEALGLAPVIRGRLVWVRLDPRLPQLATAVRRVTLVAAPAVLAVTHRAHRGDRRGTRRAGPRRARHVAAGRRVGAGRRGRLAAWRDPHGGSARSEPRESARRAGVRAGRSARPRRRARAGRHAR